MTFYIFFLPPGKFISASEYLAWIPNQTQLFTNYDTFCYCELFFTCLSDRGKGYFCQLNQLSRWPGYHCSMWRPRVQFKFLCLVSTCWGTCHGLQWCCHVRSSAAVISIKWYCCITDTVHLSMQSICQCRWHVYTVLCSEQVACVVGNGGLSVKLDVNEWMAVLTRGKKLSI